MISVNKMIDLACDDDIKYGPGVCATIKSPKAFSHTPIYFYHVTTSKEIKTKEVTLKPHIVTEGEPEIDHIRRTCVAPTVGQCLIAQAQGATYISDNPVRIYRTMKQFNKSGKPISVKDSPLTQERWLIEPAKFELVGTIYPTEETAADFPYVLKFGKSKFKYSTIDRGTISGMSDQYKELLRINKLIAKAPSIFRNKHEWTINQQQTLNPTGINR